MAEEKKSDLERTVVEDGVVGQTMQQTEKSPFIGLVPIPSLQIDHADIDFQMEMTNTSTTTGCESTEASTDISSQWFGANVQASEKASSSQENTRSTDQSDKN